MVNSQSDKHIHLEINTTQEFLDARGLSLSDVKEATLALGQVFGRKYARMFPIKINSGNIDRIMDTFKVLRAVEDFSGFSRHIKYYDKKNIQDHLFTAKTASWLASLGMTVEFEPETPEGMKDPDLKCSKDGMQPIYIECKRIRTEKFFDLAVKQKLADLIYDSLPTCDQLNFYLLHHGSAAKVRQLVPDKNFASLIYGAGMKTQYSEVKVEGEFSVGIIRKPAIIGHEEEFLTATLEGWLQDVDTGVRLPGYAFMRGGRSIGIHGPPPDYRNIWNNKRKKSKRQSIPGHPFVTIIQDEDVLGDPGEHDRFSKDIWLTDNNTEFSGIGFLSFAHMPGEPQKPQFNYYENPHAKHPLQEVFLRSYSDFR